MALIAVLWISVLLTIIVTVGARYSRLDSRLSYSAGEAIRGKWACRAGLEQAIAILKDDTDGTDTFYDTWSTDQTEQTDDTYSQIPATNQPSESSMDDSLILAGDDSSENTDAHILELPGCQCAITITDEAGKLNINTATTKQLMGLSNMTKEIAAAIIDWRDQDKKTQASGAESSYYLSCKYPYYARNNMFKTVRELLAVRGVTPQLLYGEDTNLNGKLDHNENDGDKRLPADNEDGTLDEGWIAYLTCFSFDTNKDSDDKDRVNINTADQNTLEKSLEISKEQAKWIVDKRPSNKYKSIADLISNSSPKTKPKSNGSKDNDNSNNRSNSDNRGRNGNNNNKNNVQAKAIDLETFAEIADKITTTDDKIIPGLVNINTAPEEVISAALGDDDSTATIIVNHRLSSSGTYDSIADLLNADGMTITKFKKIAEYVTVRSNVFSINCEATSSQTAAIIQTEAIVERTQEPATLLYYYMK